MKHLVIALSAVAALALSACGDDSDDSEPLSKSEYVEQADEICAEGDETIDAAQDEFANPDSPTEEEIEKAIDDVVIPEYRRQLEELSELEPPADDQDKIDEMLDHLEAGVDALEDDYTSPDVDEEFQAASEIATEYGLEECGD